jgi:hypothetical protein
MTLDEIKAKVNALIQEAALDKEDFPEAINWGDLKCIDVVPYSYSLDEGYYITIDEASPDCPIFQKWIANEMYLRHDINVTVETEW